MLSEKRKQEIQTTLAQFKQERADKNTTQERHEEITRQTDLILDEITDELARQLTEFYNKEIGDLSTKEDFYIEDTPNIHKIDLDEVG